MCEAVNASHRALQWCWCHGPHCKGWLFDHRVVDSVGMAGPASWLHLLHHMCSEHHSGISADAVKATGKETHMLQQQPGLQRDVVQILLHPWQPAMLPPQISRTCRSGIIKGWLDPCPRLHTMNRRLALESPTSPTIPLFSPTILCFGSLTILDDLELVSLELYRQQSWYSI